MAVLRDTFCEKKMAMEQVQKPKYEKEEDESRETIFYLILSMFLEYTLLYIINLLCNYFSAERLIAPPNFIYHDSLNNG